MKKNAITFIIAAVLLVIFVLLLFTYQVRQSEVVVVSTFLKSLLQMQRAYKFNGDIDNMIEYM